jgi:hypothetical protein
MSNEINYSRIVVSMKRNLQQYSFYWLKKTPQTSVTLLAFLVEIQFISLSHEGQWIPDVTVHSILSMFDVQVILDCVDPRRLCPSQLQSATYLPQISKLILHQHKSMQYTTLS